MAIKLGQLLVNNNIIKEEQLDQALELQKKEGGRLGSNLIKLGFLTDETLVEFLSEQYGVPSVSLSHEDVEASITKLVPYDIAYKYQIFPISRSGATLTIAMTDPSNVFAIDDIKFMTGYEVKPVIASESAIKDAITRHYEQSDALQTVVDNMAVIDGSGLDLIHDEEDDVDESDLKNASEEAPVVKLVNLILGEAIKRGARISKEGFVVCKAARPRQDMRWDVPVVGPDTIKTIIECKGSVLALEAKKMCLVDKDETLRLADENNVSIIVI